MNLPAKTTVPMPGMMHVIIPYNSKGGVGKSFIALSLAAGVKRIQPNARVLLIDATQDQSTHSADFAPTKELEGIGLGSAVGMVLKTLNADPVRAAKGREEARKIIEQALTKVSVVPASDESDGLIDFLPNAADELIYHSAAWRQLPNPEAVIATILEPFQDRWDWIIVDLPAALDGVSMRGFLPLASSVVIPEDLRHTKNLSGLERTIRTLRGLKSLNLAGFLPNFIQDTEPCRTAMADLTAYANSEGINILPGLPEVTTLTRTFDTIYADVNGVDVVGSGLYHLLASRNPSIAKKALEMVPVIEGMAAAVMHAAIATEETAGV